MQNNKIGQPDVVAQFYLCYQVVIIKVTFFGYP